MMDYSDGALADFIKIEKRLCEILGKPWAPSGMSINTLLDELEDKVNGALADAAKVRST